MPLDIDSLKRHLSKHFITLVGNQVVPAKRMRQFWFTPLDTPAEDYHVANKKYVDVIPLYREFGPGVAGTVGNWRFIVTGGVCELQECTAAGWASYTYHGRWP